MGQSQENLQTEGQMERRMERQMDRPYFIFRSGSNLRMFYKFNFEAINLLQKANFNKNLL